MIRSLLNNVQNFFNVFQTLGPGKRVKRSLSKKRVCLLIVIEWEDDIRGMGGLGVVSRVCD